MLRDTQPVNCCQAMLTSIAHTAFDHSHSTDPCNTRSMHKAAVQVRPTTDRVCVEWPRSRCKAAIAFGDRSYWNCVLPVPSLLLAAFGALVTRTCWLSSHLVSMQQLRAPRVQLQLPVATVVLAACKAMVCTSCQIRRRACCVGTTALPSVCLLHPVA